MWYKYIILAVLSYLIGSVSPSFFFGKMKKIDIRKYGSGNLGSTNTMRVLGVKYALITFLLDAFKGFGAVWICYAMFSGDYIDGRDLSYLFSGIAVSLGHNFPFYLKFSGGKGIATAFGVACFLNPFAAICLLVMEWILVFITKYMSVASIISCIAYPFFVNLFRLNTYISNAYTWIACSVIGLLAILRHIPNIKRLISGNENKFTFKKKKES